VLEPGKPIRLAAFTFGVLFLVSGVGGFIPSLTTPPGATGDYPHFLGIFPTNGLHNTVHLVFGAAGVTAGASAAWAWRYLLAVAVVFAVLAVAGLIPALATFGGHLPVHGPDVLLHIFLSVGALVAMALAAPRNL
jgi:hypothetical protein